MLLHLAVKYLEYPFAHSGPLQCCATGTFLSCRSFVCRTARVVQIAVANSRMMVNTKERLGFPRTELMISVKRAMFSVWNGSKYSCCS